MPPTIATYIVASLPALRSLVYTLRCNRANMTSSQNFARTQSRTVLQLTLPLPARQAAPHSPPLRDLSDESVSGSAASRDVSTEAAILAGPVSVLAGCVLLGHTERRIQVRNLSDVHQRKRNQVR